MPVLFTIGHIAPKSALRYRPIADETTQTGRPVTLDEAFGHRLRSTRAAAAHAKPAAQQPPAAVTSKASVSSLPSRPPAEQARQAIERINGVGQHDTA